MPSRSFQKLSPFQFYTHLQTKYCTFDKYDCSSCIVHRSSLIVFNLIAIFSRFLIAINNQRFDESIIVTRSGIVFDKMDQTMKRKKINKGNPVEMVESSSAATGGIKGMMAGIARARRRKRAEKEKEKEKKSKDSGRSLLKNARDCSGGRAANIPVPPPSFSFLFVFLFSLGKRHDVVQRRCTVKNSGFSASSGKSHGSYGRSSRSRWRKFSCHVSELKVEPRRWMPRGELTRSTIFRWNCRFHRWWSRWRFIRRVPLFQSPVIPLNNYVDICDPLLVLSSFGKSSCKTRCFL